MPATCAPRANSSANSQVLLALLAPSPLALPSREGLSRWILNQTPHPQPVLPPARSLLLGRPPVFPRWSFLPYLLSWDVALLPLPTPRRRWMSSQTPLLLPSAARSIPVQNSPLLLLLALLLLHPVLPLANFPQPPRYLLLALRFPPLTPQSPPPARSLAVLPPRERSSRVDCPVEYRGPYAQVYPAPDRVLAPLR